MWGSRLKFELLSYKESGSWALAAATATETETETEARGSSSAKPGSEGPESLRLPDSSYAFSMPASRVVRWLGTGKIPQACCCFDADLDDVWIGIGSGDRAIRNRNLVTKATLKTRQSPWPQHFSPADYLYAKIRITGVSCAISSRDQQCRERRPGAFS